MRAITIRQPWASLIALGQKFVETRSRRIGFRGPLAIHASGTLEPWQVALMAEEPFRTVLEAAGLIRVDPGDRSVNVTALPLGAIVAHAELIACAPVEEVRIRLLPKIALQKHPPHEIAFGDYSAGRFGWLLDQVRPLRHPIPARGALGLWRPDVALQVAVRQAVMPAGPAR